MAIDIIARGLASSIIGADGKIASEKMPTIEGTSGLTGFYPLGKLTDPSLIEGKTAEEILLMMLFGVVSPTLTDPSFSVELTSGATAIIGRESQVIGALNFDRGSISPAYGTSGYRAGLPISYLVGDHEEASTATSYNFTVALTPTVGDNEIICQVNYGEGEQPLNSIGQPIGAPLPAGSLFTSFVVKGIYALYIADGSEQEFTYFVEEDGEGYQTIMASEGTGIKQSFAIAKGVTVIGVKVFDDMSQQWVWIGGSAEDSLATFDTSTLEGESLGEEDDYVLYTHNGSRTGERELRVYVAYN